MHRFADRLWIRLGVATAAASICALALADPAAASINLVQTGSADIGTGTSFSPTLGSASTAGDLLIADVTDLNANCSNDSWSAPSGWVQAASTCFGSNGPNQIWYYPDAPAGITSATFSCGCSSASGVLQLSEWSGVATNSPLDQTGTDNVSTASSAPSVTTGGNIALAGELAFADFQTSTGETSLGAGSGFTTLGADTTDGLIGEYQVGPSSGSALTASVSASPATGYGGAIATFAPAPTCTGGTLGLYAPPTLSFSAVTLNGYSQNATATLSATVDDETGSGSGWALSGTSTTLSTGTYTLPTTATSITSAGTSTGSQTCSAPTNDISYPVTLPAGSTPPSAVTMFDAATSTGEGPVTISLHPSVSVPGSAYSGSYSSTWTLTLSSGP